MSEEQNGTEKTDGRIDLAAAERIVSWRSKDARTVRRHIFRRITAADWAGYFTSLVIESDDESRTIDVNSAGLWLFGQCCVRAEGYEVAGGGKLEELPSWRDRIRIGLRLQAIELLMRVTPSAAAPPAIEPGLETVKLDALWGEAEPGKMKFFAGLEHRFRTPTAQDQTECSRELARTLVGRGSARGKTIYPARQKMLVRLYDRLIDSVDGYALAGGEPLGGQAQIAREMDALHKTVAVGQLFSSQPEEIAEEAAP